MEQYEYMPGPNDGAGIKVLVHHPMEVPLMEEFGMAVPPGTQAYLGIPMMEVTMYKFSPFSFLLVRKINCNTTRGQNYIGFVIFKYCSTIFVHD